MRLRILFCSVVMESQLHRPVELTISAMFRPWAMSKFNGHGVKSITILQKKQEEALIERRFEKTVYRHFHFYELERWYDRTFNGDHWTTKESLQKAHRKKLLERRVKKFYRRFYPWSGESLKNARRKDYVDEATEQMIMQIFHLRFIDNIDLDTGYSDQEYNTDTSDSEREDDTDVGDTKQTHKYPGDYLYDLEKEEKEKYLVMINGSPEESFLRMLLDIKLYLDVELVHLVHFKRRIDNCSYGWNNNDTSTKCWGRFYERVLINGAIAMEEYYEEFNKQDAIVTLSHRLLRNYVIVFYSKVKSNRSFFVRRIPECFREQSRKFIDFVLST
ncbi:uncharacterized protein LOC135846832 isoform X2 [Planococcus citri]|uniref:uncharacterized protein LOC135846832 isoform X2 n=1 Tax=Planococcus citri TaxID=170843 RepID=UPI0031F866BC